MNECGVMLITWGDDKLMAGAFPIYQLFQTQVSSQ